MFLARTGGNIVYGGLRKSAFVSEFSLSLKSGFCTEIWGSSRNPPYTPDVFCYQIKIPLMIKVLKKIGIIFLILLLVLGLSFLLVFPNKISVNEKIKFAPEMRKLKSKKINPLINIGGNSKEANTDFYLDYKTENKNEVFFRFHANLNEKPIKFETLNFRISTGFNGTSVEVHKINNRFKTIVSDFTDNTAQEKLTEYKVLSQELTLDKINYKRGDSIFGKIKLEIEEKRTDDTKAKYISQGYFKHKIK